MGIIFLFFLNILWMLCAMVEDVYTMDEEFKRYYPSGQVLTVSSKKKDSFEGIIEFYEKKPGGWKKIYSFDVVLGRAGIVDGEKKREGDKATPAGVFTLGFVFGYDKNVDTKMKYVELKNSDKWIDDPEHPLYNHFVSGDTDAKSYEIMRRDDGLYKLGVVINYNIEPVVKYKGSAIFLHIWKDSKTPTGGCVALHEESLRAIIKWLDPEKKPLIVIKN